MGPFRAILMRWRMSNSCIIHPKLLKDPASSLHNKSVSCYLAPCDRPVGENHSADPADLMKNATWTDTADDVGGSSSGKQEKLSLLRATSCSMLLYADLAMKPGPFGISDI